MGTALASLPINGEHDMASASPRLFAADTPAPEGPAFDAAGSLFVVCMDNGNILKLDPQGRIEVFANTGGHPNGLAFGPGGLLYITEAGLKAILVADAAGNLQTVTTAADGKPLLGPNDLCFDARGNFYFTDPVGSSADHRSGRVCYATPAGEAHIVAEGLAFPNGLALTPDGAHLYVVNELAHEMVRFATRPDGSLDAGEHFCPIRRGGIGGDGMALDVAGNLYVTNFGLGTVDVIAPTGELLDLLPAGGLKPTNVAFGGPDRRDLYITELETAAVYVHRNHLAGLALGA